MQKIRRITRNISAPALRLPLSGRRQALLLIADTPGAEPPRCREQPATRYWAFSTCKPKRHLESAPQPAHLLCCLRPPIVAPARRNRGAHPCLVSERGNVARGLHACPRRSQRGGRGRSYPLSRVGRLLQARGRSPPPPQLNTCSHVDRPRTTPPSPVDNALALRRKARPGASSGRSL